MSSPEKSYPFSARQVGNGDFFSQQYELVRPGDHTIFLTLERAEGRIRANKLVPFGYPVAHFVEDVNRLAADFRLHSGLMHATLQPEPSEQHIADPMEIIDGVDFPCDLRTLPINPKTLRSVRMMLEGPSFFYENMGEVSTVGAVLNATDPALPSALEIMANAGSVQDVPDRAKLAQTVLSLMPEPGF